MGMDTYIEFWGRESDPMYRERTAIKQAIYAKHNLRLIELSATAKTRKRFL